MLYEIKWKTNQKIRNKKYETVGIVPKSKTKSIPLTYKIIHDRWLSYLGTETSIKWRGKTRLETQISLLQTQNNTWPFTFLSWYRNFNKNWRGKTRLKTQISPLTDIQNNTWPLTFLSWYRNFNKKWRGKTRLNTQISPLTDTAHFPILVQKLQYNWWDKTRFRSQITLLQTWCGHESVFHMSLLQSLSTIVLKNALILNILHSIFQLTMVIVQTLISTVRVVNV